MLFASPLLGAEDEGKKTSDRWYVMMIEGQRVGWTHEWSTETDNSFDTRTEARMLIKRGGAELEIHMTTRWVESKDGRPIMAMSTQDMSFQKIEQVMVFRHEQDQLKDIVLTTKQGNSVKKTVVPAPDERWFPPAAVSREFERLRMEGKETIEINTMDPSFGTNVISSKFSFVKETTVDVFGKTLPAQQWAMETSALPGIKNEMFTDEKGTPLFSTIDIAGMKISILAADKEVATSEFEAPELLADSLVAVDQPIKNPRSLRKAIFRLRLTDNTKFEMPTIGSQRSEQMDDHSVRVTLDLDANFTVPDDKPGKEHLAATSYLNHESDEIEALVDQWLEGKDDLGDAKKAEHLREKVYEFVNKKSLGVGFATATEVAKTKQGDCTEHGVLLAAVLRGAGIPSRTVTGLIYADRFLDQRNIFGYHMWTQAWVEDEDGGQWIDLDAVLNADHPFDATHIAITHSSMKDGETFNDMVRLAPFFGRLEIELEADN